MPARSRAAARRLVLRRLIGERSVHSQEELVGLLARHGHRVTQATVSRDLAALGVSKTPRPGGGERYALAGGPAAAGDGHLLRMLREFVTAIAHSGNVVVLKTPPGAAQPVASALDAAPPRGVLGTVAGDDTILIIAAPAAGGPRVARTLQRLMAARNDS
jgi:transcriptional regulator of arginine metabolism